jgi:hypothetical protein
LRRFTNGRVIGSVENLDQGEKFRKRRLRQGQSTERSKKGPGAGWWPGPNSCDTGISWGSSQPSNQPKHVPGESEAAPVEAMQGARWSCRIVRLGPSRSDQGPAREHKSLNRSGGIDLSQRKGPGEPGPNSRDALVVSTNFSKRADARPTVCSSSRSGNYTFPGARAGGLMAYGPYRRVGILAGNRLTCRSNGRRNSSLF